METFTKTADAKVFQEETILAGNYQDHAQFKILATPLNYGVALQLIPSTNMSDMQEDYSDLTVMETKENIHNMIRALGPQFPHAMFANKLTT